MGGAGTPAVASGLPGRHILQGLHHAFWEGGLVAWQAGVQELLAECDGYLQPTRQELTAAWLPLQITYTQD